MVAATAIKPKVEEGKWSSRLSFEPTPVRQHVDFRCGFANQLTSACLRGFQEGKHVTVRVDDSGVKFALARLTKSFLVRTFTPEDMVYEASVQM
jgi:hypothetical protein